MEVNSGEEHNYKGTSILVSQSNHSPIGSSVELVTAHDKQKADKCEHFSIRGYVAEVRKRDTKICWPFLMRHNHSSDDYSYSLPPLSVTKSRWWGCQNCQLKDNALEAATACGVVMNSQNVEVTTHNTSFLGNSIVASHADGTKLLSSFQKLSKDKILEGRLVEADCSISERNGECRPSLGCGKKRKESLTTGLIKEGFQISKGADGSSEENRNKLAGKSIYVATKGEPWRMGERVERNMTMTAESLETALQGENVPTVENVKRQGIQLIHDTFDSEMVAEIATSMSKNVGTSGHKDNEDISGKNLGKVKKPCLNVVGECGMPLGVDTGVPEDDAVIAVAANKSDLNSVGLDEINHEGLNKVQGHNNASQVGASNGNVHRKKVRKVRLLNDIIKSEALGMSEKVQIFNGDAESSQPEDDKNRRPDASVGRSQHPYCESNVSSHETTMKSTKKSKKSSEALQNEDEGPSLMHWLKRVPKRTMTHKVDAETKCISTAGVNSKSNADASAGKGLDLNLKGCQAKGHKQKVILERKPEVIGGRPYQMPQQDIMTKKGHTVVKDESTKQFGSTTVHLKSTRVLVTESCLLPGPEIQKTNKKDILIKKKNKEPPVEDGESSQMHWPKESCGTYQYGNVTGFQDRKKVVKKRRTMRISEQASLDDIPMDIVELLARNKHERRLMNAEAATKNIHNLSEVAGNLKNDSVLDFTEAYGNKVSDAVHKNLSWQRSQSSNTENGVWTPVGSNTDATLKPNLHHSHSSCKLIDHMDLNRQELNCTSTGFQKFSSSIDPPMSGVQLPLIESNKNCSQQNHSWKRMRMQTSESRQKDLAISGLPHVSLLERNLTKGAHETDYLKLRNPIVSHLLNRKEDESSMHQRTFPAATSSFSEAGNESHSDMLGPLDLRTIETISAMHLLRLMDPAVQSGAPLCPSVDKTRSIRESGFSCDPKHEDLLGLEGEVKTIEPPKHPWTVAHHDQDQHPGNSCKPFRPLPRIGVLGSLLQKEITTYSNNCRLLLTAKDGHPNELTSLKTVGKEKLEGTNSATQSRVPSAKISISKGEISRNRFVPAVDMFQVGINNKDEAVQPLKSSCRTEICVVNRNPADFTIPGEDNVYMIRSADSRPRYVNPSESLQRPIHLDGQRQQKVMKLTALKGLMRS